MICIWDGVDLSSLWQDKLCLGLGGLSNPQVWLAPPEAGQNHLTPGADQSVEEALGPMGTHLGLEVNNTLSIPGGFI